MIWTVLFAEFSVNARRKCPPPLNDKQLYRKTEGGGLGDESNQTPPLVQFSASSFRPLSAYQDDQP